MPHKPLVSKIRCHNPNKPGASARNWHLLYYIVNRPGSLGLFGNIETSDIIHAANHVADLTSEGRNIYNGIVSLSEEDALELGYTGQEKWELFIRAALPDVAEQFGIPASRLRWCAAVHPVKGHPHLHYMFWDSEKRICSSFIHESTQHKCRAALSKEMFRAERERAIADKTLWRDSIISGTKDFLGQDFFSTSLPADSPIPDRIPKETLLAYGRRLYGLTAALPAEGNLKYAYLPPETKKLVNSFVDEILNTKALSGQYTAFQESIVRISQTYSPTDNHTAYHLDTACRDLKKRLANVVLKECGEIRKSGRNFPDEPSRTPGERAGNGFFPNPPLPPELPDTMPDPSDSFPDFPMLPDFSRTVPDPDSVPNGGHDVPKNYIYDYSRQYKQALKHIYAPKELRDPALALPLLSKEAARHNVLAYQELAKLYANRLVPDVSPEESARLGGSFYEKALSGLLQLEARNAGCENPKAVYAYKLGKLYEKGLGTEQDYALAREYYEAACRYGNGYKYAEYALGSMYLYENVEKFTDENRLPLMRTGLSHIKKAADAGFAYAMYTYAKTMETDFPGELPPEDLEGYNANALSGFEKMLAERRDDSLLYRIGTMYYEGKGTPPDQDAAYEYFKEAASLGNANAQYALGKTHADPESGYFDAGKAVHYLSLARENGLSYASYALGKLYCNPESDVYDPRAGLRFFLEAAGNGDMYALAKLGNIYLWGNHPGIGKDAEKGLAFLRRSSELGNEYAAESIRFYEEVQHGISENLAVRTGFRCFSSLLSSMVSARKTQDAYAEWRMYQNAGRAAKKAAATREGRYVPREEE